MKKVIILLMAVATFFAWSPEAAAQYQHKAKAVKTANTEADKNLVEVAIGSDQHTTLVAAIKAADLVSALQAEGPFTVFAPTNAAFDKLPDGTLNTLLQPENKKMLTNILTYHVVPASLDSKAVVEAIKAGNGKAEVKTLSGDTLTATLKDGSVYLMDENGNMSKVTAVDIKATNGVIHVINTVVLPK